MVEINVSSLENGSINLANASDEVQPMEEQVMMVTPAGASSHDNDRDDIEVTIVTTGQEQQDSSDDHVMPSSLHEPQEINDDDDEEQTATSTTTTTSEGKGGVLVWAAQHAARRVARNPTIYLVVSLLLSATLSTIGMIVGNFSIDADPMGWRSRGTLISDRHTQQMLTTFHQGEMLYGGDEVWDDLLDHVQPGWEMRVSGDDNNHNNRRRRRNLGEEQREYSSPTRGSDDGGGSSSIDTALSDVSIATGTHPFRNLRMKNENGHEGEAYPPRTSLLVPNIERLLQSEHDSQNISTSHIMEGCDTSYYKPSVILSEDRLWPIWKTKSPTDTVLDPQVLLDICLGEESTQRTLEEEGLCIPCNSDATGPGITATTTKCLPPVSIVLYARLVVQNGMDLSCQELSEAWKPFQHPTEKVWKSCIKETKERYDPRRKELPQQCPFGFSPSLVDGTFDQTLLSHYTSSIFATREDDVAALYELVDRFDRSDNEKVLGAYDTQSADFMNRYFEHAIVRDTVLGLLSAIIVSFAMIIHTKSPFLTFFGLIQIVMSFPLSFFFYKLVLGLNFFPFLNFMGVFIVFALGAGDVFVATDKWKNARRDTPNASTEDVAAVALPDAAAAMFLTTSTTAVAFFATTICPVPSIRMFAIFCGLLIIFDYIMNVLLVFPALCLYDKMIVKHQQEQQSGNNSDNNIISCFVTFMRQQKTFEEHGSFSKDDATHPPFIQRLLLEFYGFIHAIRWPLLVVCLAAMGVSLKYASTLELPTSSDVPLMDESVQFEQNTVWRQHLLSKALAGGSQASFIWGVKPADTGDHSDPNSWSQLMLDDTFDPSSEEAQIYLAEFCDSVFEQPFAETVEPDYICPMRRFSTWLREQFEIGTRQIDNAEQHQQQQHQDAIYIQYCNNASALPMPQHEFHSCIIGWAQSTGETSILPYQNKVQIMFVPFTSRVRYDSPYDVLDTEWKAIESWMASKNVDEAPMGVEKGYFTSFDFWWYDTNGQMLQTAYSAAGIALACAASVILISSRSVILTIFSTLTIGYVLTSVTAVLVGMGWSLGYLEAVCFAILIGVSVDFVIHFSHAYTVPPGDTNRGERTKYALVTMGPSILATGATTVLSSIVMIFTIITFFQKFALILFFSILQATAGSFVVFLTMTDCAGPSNPTYLVDRFFLGKIPASHNDDDDDDGKKKKQQGKTKTNHRLAMRTEQSSTALTVSCSSKSLFLVDEELDLQEQPQHRQQEQPNPGYLVPICENEEEDCYSV